MKNRVEKKITKKKRKTSEQLVRRNAKAIFRTSIVSFARFKEKRRISLRGDACQAYESRGKRRKEETRYETGQSWLVNLLVTMLASHSWLTFPGSVATDQRAVSLKIVYSRGWRVAHGLNYHERDMKISRRRRCVRSFPGETWRHFARRNCLKSRQYAGAEISVSGGCIARELSTGSGSL